MKRITEKEKLEVFREEAEREYHRKMMTEIAREKAAMETEARYMGCVKTHEDRYGRIPIYEDYGIVGYRYPTDY